MIRDYRCIIAVWKSCLELSGLNAGFAEYIYIYIYTHTHTHTYIYMSFGIAMFKCCLWPLIHMFSLIFQVSEVLIGHIKRNASA
jgi:hypothetical protein